MARYAGSRPRSGGGSVVLEAGGTQRNATQGQVYWDLESTHNDWIKYNFIDIIYIYI